MADPSIMFAQPNAGERFAQAFDKGMYSNAMRALMQNPNDPNALASVGRYDPQGALQYSLQQRQQQAQMDAQKLEEWKKYAGSLAKWADTPDKWDQAVDYLVQSGHPEAAQHKGKFSPALRAHFLAQAGISEDKPQLVPYTEGGGVAQYDPATGQLKTLVAPNPGGVAPGTPVQQAPPPEAIARLKSNPQEASQFDEIFGPGASQRVLGGSGGNVGGGFPDPLAPL